VVNEEGLDVTDRFLRAAEAVCEIAKLVGARKAYLKEGSPSCGVSRVIVDGRETGGLGVTAAALVREGVAVQPLG